MRAALLIAALFVGDPVDLPRLLAEMSDRASLARFPDPPYRACAVAGAPAASALALRANERVALDAAGPGVITRIAAAHPRGRLRLYVDDAAPAGRASGDATPHAPAATLDVDLLAFLSGEAGVAPPLASAHRGGATSLVPLAFARRAVLTIEEDDASPREVAVEWRRYPTDTPVVAFARGDLERHAAAIQRANRALDGASTPADEVTHTFHLSRNAPEGELLATGPRGAAGPRAVTELRLRVDAADPARALRTCVLRLTFDGAETVAAPLGAFFGAHEDLRPLRTRLTSVDETGELAARFVMPYRATLALRVDNAGDPDLHLSGAVRTTPWEWDERSMHFHATWRATGRIATPPVTATHARVAGRGVLVGDFLAVANPVVEPWDGGTVAIVGGGADFRGARTRDHYGGAHGEAGTFQSALLGRTRADGPGEFGRSDVYRLRALDAVPFETALVYAHSSGRERGIERAACTFWYALPGATEGAPPVPRDPEPFLPQLPYARVDGAVEAESARVVASSPGVTFEREASPTAGWSGGLQLGVRATRPGDFLELEIPASPGRRRVEVRATRGADRVRWSIDGDVVEPQLEARDGVVRVRLGVRAVGATFRLRAELRGDDAPRELGLDAVVVAPDGG